MPDPKISGTRHKAIDSLVKANLGSGRLTIDCMPKTNMHFTPPVVPRTRFVQVLNEAGTAVPVSLDRDQIFGADVFSQNEIEEMASSPAAQLRPARPLRGAGGLGDLPARLEQLRLRKASRALIFVTLMTRSMICAARRQNYRYEGSKYTEVTGPDAARINAAHLAKGVSKPAKACAWRSGGRSEQGRQGGSARADSLSFHC
ncbi:MAG: hypothetical protein R2752_13120 [Vicinamibacterales bacterium]